MAKLCNEYSLYGCLLNCIVDKSKQLRDKKIIEELCHKVRMRKIYLEISILNTHTQGHHCP